MRSKDRHKFSLARAEGLDVKGKTLALMLLGYPFARIQQLLAEEGVPPELIPSNGALSNWRQEWRPELLAAYTQRVEDLARRVLGYADKVMDEVEAGRLELKPVAAFTMLGIMADKVARLEDARSRQRGADDLSAIREAVRRRQAELAAQSAAPLPPPQPRPIDAKATPVDTP